MKTTRTQKQAFVELLELDAVIRGQKRYCVFSDGSVLRNRNLNPLIHNGKKARK